ncbi:MAG: 5-bromo-4-chloroindolyl phosphate hydrolysis family protein [Lachnospiraceae bacterium]|nr:5-bromo-4-chloroindolyl phosphate hydrolysis family protein [Lachnospiraceae bacterium]
MADNHIFNDIGDEIGDALKLGLTNGDYSKLNDAIKNSVNKVLDEATGQLERSAGINTSRTQNVSTHKYSTYSAGQATRERQKQLERERQQRQEEYRRQAELRKQNSGNVYYERRNGSNINGKINNATHKRQQSFEERRQRAELLKRMRSPNAIVANGKLLPTKFNAVNDTLSVLSIVFGAIGTFIFGLLSMGAIAGFVTDAKEIGSVMLFLVPTLISAAFIFKGIYDRKMLERAKRYARMCGEKMYAKISQLASATGMEEKKLKKEVKKLLKKGYYPEGYIDEEETTLMLSDQVYNEYTTMKSRMKTEEKQRKDEAEKLTGEEQTELGLMMSEGTEAINKLHKLNDEIPGEVISAKLDVLEDLLKQIFNCVREHPEQMDRMHKLMDYYLPTMLKLVEAYAEYDKISAPGKEILEAKTEIENTLDTINEAFVQLLNNLFQESVWDVTSDAQVLTTMLTQEGLAKEEALKTK